MISESLRSNTHHLLPVNDRLFIITSPYRRETREAQLLVTCSKGTNTSTPIILKWEARIASVQITGHVFSFFSTPPHADRFECSLLWLCGPGKQHRSSASWSLWMFSAPISRLQVIHLCGWIWQHIIYLKHSYPSQTHHPQLTAISEHNKIKRVRKYEQ